MRVSSVVLTVLLLLAALTPACAPVEQRVDPPGRTTRSVPPAVVQYAHDLADGPWVKEATGTAWYPSHVPDSYFVSSISSSYTAPDRVSGPLSLVVTYTGPQGAEISFFQGSTIVRGITSEQARAPYDKAAVVPWGDSLASNAASIPPVNQGIGLSFSREEAPPQHRLIYVDWRNYAYLSASTKVDVAVLERMAASMQKVDAR